MTSSSKAYYSTNTIIIYILCSIDGSQIRCISASFDDMGDGNTNKIGPVEVVIDNVLVSNGIEFEFRDNPVYTAVSPQRVIPA